MQPGATLPVPSLRCTVTEGSVLLPFGSPAPLLHAGKSGNRKRPQTVPLEKSARRVHFQVLSGFATVGRMLVRQIRKSLVKKSVGTFRLEDSQ